MTLRSYHVAALVALWGLSVTYLMAKYQSARYEASQANVASYRANERLRACQPREDLAREIFTCEQSLMHAQDVIDALLQQRAETAEQDHGHQQCSDGACELPRRN